MAAREASCRLPRLLRGRWPAGWGGKSRPAAAVVAAELEDSTERKVREGDRRYPYRFTEGTER